MSRQKNMVDYSCLFWVWNSYSLLTQSRQESHTEVEEAPHVFKIGRPKTNNFNDSFQCEESDEGDIENVHCNLCHAWHAVLFHRHRAQVYKCYCHQEYLKTPANGHVVKELLDVELSESRSLFAIRTGNIECLVSINDNCL